MARIELSLTVDYVHGWGLWEGLREVLQNGVDAEKEFSARLHVGYDARSRTLTVKNEGCSLERDALLMGFSSKRGRSDTIGVHGEGLKTGSIALLRHGCSVTIRTAGETWKAEIETSDKFKARVLVFNVAKSGGEYSRVQVEVGNLDPDEWEAYKDRFLFLDHGYRLSEDVVKTDTGDLLLAEDQRGKVYVKGMFVEDRTDILYGYNLHHVGLDRDRSMVDSYDLRSAMACIIAKASASSAVVKKTLASLIDSDAEDMASLRYSNPDALLGSAVVDELVSQFRLEHGENAVPCESTEESQSIGHLGKVGVVVASRFKRLLEMRLGTLGNLKKAMLDKDTGTVDYLQLTDAERANFNFALDTVDFMEHPPVNIVGGFMCPEIVGTHSEDKIRLARSLLADKYATLRVLVHEVAHEAGKDGEKAHVSRIEKIWTMIYSNLRKTCIEEN